MILWIEMIFVIVVSGLHIIHDMGGFGFKKKGSWDSYQEEINVI